MTEVVFPKILMNEDNLFCVVLAKVQREEDFMSKEFVPYLTASSMVSIAWTCKKLYLAYKRFFCKRYEFVGTFNTFHPPHARIVSPSFFADDRLGPSTGRMSRWGRRLAGNFVIDPFGIREDSRVVNTILSYRTVKGIVHGVIKVKNRQGRVIRSMYVRDGSIVHGPVMISKRANMAAVLRIIDGTIIDCCYRTLKNGKI